MAEGGESELKLRSANGGSSVATRFRLPCQEASGWLSGISEAQGLYVGDHRVDAEAAMAAGIPFFPVLTGATSRDEFQRFPHVEILESVSSLPPYLSGLAAWPPAQARSAACP